jgi:hypothetical protein
MTVIFNKMKNPDDKPMYLVQLWFLRCALASDYCHVYPGPFTVETKILCTWGWSMLIAVVPTAAATALDIDLSNISIVFISVSFATMVSFSMTPSAGLCTNHRIKCGLQ